MRNRETLLQRVTQEEVDAQVVRLNMLLRLLDRMFEESVQFTSSAPRTLLVATILKVRQSGRAVKLLAEEGLVEDILAIGQTLVEVTVNATYLQCVNEKEVGRYLSFHPEMGYQQGGMMQQRRGRPSGQGLIHKLSNVVSSLVPSGRWRKGEASWTTCSLAARAQIADEMTKIPVMSAMASRCYPRGEAAVHGTMGALHRFVKAIQTGEMPEREDRLRELSEALFGVNLTMMTFSIFLNEFFQLGMGEVMDQISAADSTTRPSLLGE